jgi:DNA-binding NtrC family response regulator
MEQAKKKILVVDDEIGIRDVLYELLTRKSYEVTTVENGLRALEMLKSIRPDLIILDYRMPQMNGVETLRKIREFDDKVQVVMLTAFGTPAIEKEASSLGVADFLSKDITTSNFLKKIEEVAARLTSPVKPITPPGKVMVVDDESSVCDMLKDFLTARGCEVLAVNSGEEAVKRLPFWNPAIVILDIKMPGMDGILCLQKIKKLKPEVGVIMMTGSESLEMARQSLNMGAYEYLMKPFNLEYLATAVWSKLLFAGE